MLSRYVSLLLLLLSLQTAGCSAPLREVRQPLKGDGDLYLFTEPFSHDSYRLQFVVAGVDAVSEDGREIPLQVTLEDFQVATHDRQRLFAHGTLPPGRYTGISYRIRSATLKGEEGSGRLLLPEKPHVNQVPFVVSEGQSTVLLQSFDYAGAVSGEIQFTPRFNYRTPETPLPGLTGYLTNYSSHAIFVFDKRTGRIGKVIPTGRGPAAIVIDQPRSRAYVAIAGEDAVDIIDVMQNTIIGRIRLTAGDDPRSLAVTPDGRQIITANSGSNTMSFIDTAAQAEIDRIKLESPPERVLLDRTGRRGYVFNRLTNSITVVEVGSRSVAWTIATEAGPVYGQFNRRGDRLIVYHDFSPYLLVLDSVTLGVVRRINAGNGTGALKVNPFDDRLYLGKSFGGIVEVYDPFTMLVSEMLDVGGGISYQTIDGEENSLLMLQPRSRVIRSLNLVSRKSHILLDTGETPYWVAIYGER